MLLQRIDPVYPPIARAARISGTVVLDAVISKTGSVESLHVVSGHPMLVQAALDAVRQWRYRPFLLNGMPVEVQTTVTVTFTVSN
ncbi:MAG: energy transducer TonB [Terracidiphilus sp.]